MPERKKERERERTIGNVRSIGKDSDSKSEKTVNQRGGTGVTV